MFRDRLKISKKITRWIEISFIFVIWMLVAFLQFGGMRAYAFCVCVCLAIVEHVAITCIFLKDEQEKTKISYVLGVINLFLFFVGMILSAIIKDNSGTMGITIDEKNGVLISDITPEQKELIPQVELSNATNGVKLTWNTIKNAEGYGVYRLENDEYKCLVIIMDPKQTSYTDITALSATEYTYSVCALQRNTAGEYCPTTYVSGVWRPTLKLKKGDDMVTLTWDAIERADGYRIYRRENGGNYTEIADVKAQDSLKYEDRQIKYGVRYTYGVRAYVGEVQSGMHTKETNFTLDKTVLNVKCVSDENFEGVSLYWEAVPGAEEYEVYRRTKDEKRQKIAVLTADVLEFKDGEVGENTQYFYSVRAKKESYQNKCDEVLVLTTEFPEKKKHTLEQLKRVTVEAELKGKAVHLKWNSIENVDGYHIYKKVGTGEYSLIYTVEDITDNTYDDSNIENGQNYLYYVCAFIGTQEGSYTGAKIEVK